MNRMIIYCILIMTFIHLVIESEAIVLNKMEETLSISLIKELEIRHCILIDQFSDSLINLLNIKFFSNSNVPITYKSEVQLNDYLQNETIPNVPTVIIFKTENLDSLFEILLNLNVVSLLKSIIRWYTCQFLCVNYIWCVFQLKRTKNVCWFTWLILVNWNSAVEKKVNTLGLLVPYNCEFIVAYSQNNSSNYKLIEIYRVKDKQKFYDYGNWNLNDGLTTTNLSMSSRRMNLNGTDLIVQVGQSGKMCQATRECVQIEILRYIGEIMHSRWIPKVKEVNVTPDAFYSAYPFHSFYFRHDCIGPIFKIMVNWYIKNPEYVGEANYYTKPFNISIWISILTTVIIGGLVIVIIQHFNEYINSRRPVFVVSDKIFSALDFFCNQDGYKYGNNVPCRIACITIRLAVTIIISAYSAVILSFLTVRFPEIPFNNLEEFARNGKYMLAGLNNRFPNAFFERNADPLAIRINESLLQRLNKGEELGTVCFKKVAVMTLDNDLYAFPIPCHVYQIKKPITYTFSCVSLPIDSPFRTIFNYNLIKIYSSGIQAKSQRTLHKMHLNKTRKEENENEFESVTLGQMRDVLLTVPIGATFGIIICFFEICYKYLRPSKMKLFLRKRTRNGKSLKI